MLMHLIKKDLLIAKRLVIVAMLVVVAIPLIILWGWATPSVTSFIPFVYMVMMAELLIFQTVSQTEAKNPKAASLLCVAPYSRRVLVKAKYALMLLIFAYCFVVHTVMMLIVSSNHVLGLPEILAGLLFTVIVFGLYLPVEFKYGFVKARFFFMILILAASLGPTLLVNLFPHTAIDLSVFQSMSYATQCIVLAVASVVVLAISIMISVRIYEKKDL